MPPFEIGRASSSVEVPLGGGSGDFVERYA